MLVASGNKLFYYTWVKDPMLVYTKDLEQDGGTTLLPVYMAPFL